MRKGFVLTVDFSAFSMSRTIIIAPEFMMPWRKSVCTVLQALGLSAGYRRENQPNYSPEARCHAALLHGQQQQSIFHVSLQWDSPARTPGCPEQSHDLQITAQGPPAWDGCCPLPAQGMPQWFQRQRGRYPNPRLATTQPFVPWMCR